MADAGQSTSAMDRFVPSQTTLLMGKDLESSLATFTKVQKIAMKVRDQLYIEAPLSFGQARCTIPPFRRVLQVPICGPTGAGKSYLENRLVATPDRLPSTPSTTAITETITLLYNQQFKTRSQLDKDKDLKLMYHVIPMSKDDWEAIYPSEKFDKEFSAGGALVHIQPKPGADLTARETAAAGQLQRHIDEWLASNNMDRQTAVVAEDGAHEISAANLSDLLELVEAAAQPCGGLHAVTIEQFQRNIKNAPQYAWMGQGARRGQGCICLVDVPGRDRDDSKAHCVDMLVFDPELHTLLILLDPQRFTNQEGIADMLNDMLAAVADNEALRPCILVREFLTDDYNAKKASMRRMHDVKTAQETCRQAEAALNAYKSSLRTRSSEENPQLVRLERQFEEAKRLVVDTVVQSWQEHVNDSVADMCSAALRVDKETFKAFMQGEEVAVPHDATDEQKQAHARCKSVAQRLSVLCINTTIPEDVDKVRQMIIKRGEEELRVKTRTLVASTADNLHAMDAAAVTQEGELSMNAQYDVPADENLLKQLNGVIDTDLLLAWEALGCEGGTVAAVHAMLPPAPTSEDLTQHLKNRFKTNPSLPGMRLGLQQYAGVQYEIQGGDIAATTSTDLARGHIAHYFTTVMASPFIKAAQPKASKLMSAALKRIVAQWANGIADAEVQGEQDEQKRNSKHNYQLGKWREVGNSAVEYYCKKRTADIDWTMLKLTHTEEVAAKLREFRSEPFPDGKKQLHVAGKEDFINAVADIMEEDLKKLSNCRAMAVVKFISEYSKAIKQAAKDIAKHMTKSHYIYRSQQQIREDDNKRKELRNWRNSVREQAQLLDWFMKTDGRKYGPYSEEAVGKLKALTGARPEEVGAQADNTDHSQPGGKKRALPARGAQAPNAKQARSTAGPEESAGANVASPSTRVAGDGVAGPSNPAAGGSGGAGPSRAAAASINNGSGGGGGDDDDDDDNEEEEEAPKRHMPLRGRDGLHMLLDAAGYRS